MNRLVGIFPDRVVGVFPEGTSYTEPRIIQVKEGAAWVALEYSKWMRESGDRDGQPIKIIPVGIAYTDKTQYLSRVSVEKNLHSTDINCGFRRSMCSRFTYDRNGTSADSLQVMANPSSWMILKIDTTLQQNPATTRVCEPL